MLIYKTANLSQLLHLCLIKTNSILYSGCNCMLCSYHYVYTLILVVYAESLNPHWISWCSIDTVTMHWEKNKLELWRLFILRQWQNRLFFAQLTGSRMQGYGVYTPMGQLSPLQQKARSWRSFEADEGSHQPKVLLAVAFINKCRG